MSPRVLCCCTFALVTSACRAKDPAERKPGLLASVEVERALAAGGSAFAADGTFLRFANLQALGSEENDRIEVWDVADPRDPTRQIDIDSGRMCFFGCGDVLAQGELILVADHSSVAGFTTTAQSWAVSGSGASTWLGAASEDDRLVSAGYEGLALTQVTQTSAEVLVFVAEYGTAGMDTLGETVAVARSSLLGPAIDEVASYLVVSSGLIPVSRHPLALESGWTVPVVPNTTRRTVALADDRSLFVLTGFYRSPDYEFETLECQLSALSLDSSIGLVGTPGRVGGCTSVLVAGSFLFLAANYEIGTGAPEPHVEVFRVDLGGEYPRLEEAGRWDLPRSAFISDLAIEADRGILFVLAEDFFEIVDIGVLTGGEPTWP